jgi:protein gp37
VPLAPNVWLGVSVEDQARADERIPLLLDTPAAVRWLSCEPLLGPTSTCSPRIR